MVLLNATCCPLPTLTLSFWDAKLDSGLSVSDFFDTWIHERRKEDLVATSAS